MLSSTSLQDVLERAKQAKLHLRAALQRMEARHISQCHVDTARTSKPSENSTTHSAISPANTRTEAPRIVSMEWPLAPLMERARMRRKRDAQLQRRRAARQPKSVAAHVSSMSAADVMRNTLSQPLGAMAARLLSAATAGAPSLFSEPAASGPGEATTAARIAESSPPTHTSNPNVAAAETVAHMLSPSSSPHKGTMAKVFPHAHHRHASLRLPSPMRTPARYCSADARLHKPLSATSATSLPPPSDDGIGDVECRRTPREYRDRLSHSLLTFRAEAPPAKHRQRHTYHRAYHSSGCLHLQPSSKPITVHSAAQPDAQHSPFMRAHFTPPSALPPAHHFFSSSPIPLLAGAFSGGGTGGFSSPTMGNDRAQRRAVSSPNAKTRDAGAAAAGGDQPLSPSSLLSTGNLLPPLHQVHQEELHSCFASSWASSDADASSPSSCDTFFCPMTAPGADRVYNPLAPLPSLLRCYGDAETRNLFDDVLSTSTQCTESRSSSPCSSEWSARTSSTNVDVTHHATATAPGRHSRSPSRPLDEPGAMPKAAANPNQGSLHVESSRRRRASPRHNGSSVPSPNVQTQHSFATEMDAIEKGQVTPYVSYLFTPEARTVDLRQLEGQLRRRESLSPVAATCIRFCPAGEAYLVGTSSGLLWRVPVSGGQVVRATPLGNLWPPHAQAGGSAISSGVGPGTLSAAPAPSANNTTTATAAAPSAVRVSPGGVLSEADVSVSSAQLSSQPTPLSGHTAAVLSIAFNEDGTLYATAGLDGCIIVWKASTSAKLRRISAVWAGASAVQRAPHLVRFMPQNNNYLLVSYVDGSALHLYNSSTGLPVTNAAGTGLARMTVSSSSIASGAGGTASAGPKGLLKGGSKTNSGTGGGRCGAITALAVDLIASPFFVSGDADGRVVLWTYRAGDLVMWPTLRATSTPASSDNPDSGSSHAARHARSRSYVIDPPGYGLHSDPSSIGGGSVFSTPLYQLPELRRVAACELPVHAGGVAAISVSTLHAAQLHSLFRPCGSPYKDVVAAAERDGEEKSKASVHAEGRSHRALETTAQVLHAAAVQNRACREELEARQAEKEEAAAAGDDATGRSRRDDCGVTCSSAIKRKGSDDSTTATRTSSGGFPHILARLPSRLSDTFSALWSGSGGGSGSHGGAPSSPSVTAKACGADSSLASLKPSTPPAVPSDFCPAAVSEKELVKQLRIDALDVVCPLLILVTAPCDTVYSLGLLLQLQHGTLHHNHGAKGSSGHPSSAAWPTVSYRLYPLLKTTGPSRMRHIGVGAVASPDNHRLVVVAAPCEEGFVRVLPLLRVETAATAAATTTARADATTPGPGSGTPKSSGGATTQLTNKHVLATLPMPYGGRCTGVAWSPSGRFLVTITSEGIIYEWSRVYLLSTTITGCSSTAVNGATRKAVAGSLKRDTGFGKGRSSSNGAACHASLVSGEDDSSVIAPTTTAKGARKISTAADAAGVPANAAAAATQRRGCDTEYSDTVHRPASTLNFTSLLGRSMAAPTAATASTAVLAGQGNAACAAFLEEDAWRESFQRELERQRREQAALKLVTSPGDQDESEVSSSGYWLDGDAKTEGSLDTFDDDEETEEDDATASP
ncbi:hypothetical protein ABL78_1451 [Leptomonas seymouri]|uniref:Uncharacterized protein n=1 Tax=Leptomonas seymouri TaxID=5684 RepID=A0A0N1I8V8_LEPSE|nr:hypothetical protein ABL78_1451 [Leptomonas seymouri]|eukprot:KPI89415.1 hypothetical protein ABL78_1451 [Leptomonas seymouri]